MSSSSGRRHQPRAQPVPALQVIETGLPVVVALNMADLVEKNGDKIDTDKLSKKLGCPVMMISALKNKGITELFEQVKKSAASKGQCRSTSSTPPSRMS